MKKISLIIGSLAFFQFFAQAQLTTKPKQEKLKKTEIELVYNHYIQDGDNSAVTGGIGTEELKVYGPSLSLKKTSGRNKVSTKVGADIITSASTDNINFVVSSASRVDVRYFGSVDYARTLDDNLEISGGVSMSLESDYLSRGGNLGFAKQDKNKLRTVSAQFQYFNDDLRWGRITKTITEYKLVIPIELRHKEWYEDYIRRSYNLKLGISQIVNKRNILGVYPELTYQKGLLATPFHRVYFSDGSLGVEQLPYERYKGAVSFRLNTFVKGNIILKNSIGLYADDFGVLAFSVGNETAIKLSPIISILPNVRFYSQKGSPYFNGHKLHDSEEKYFTSDYDFSTLQTYKAGMGVRYSPSEYLGKRIKFNSVLIRYGFLYRSNGLTAHIISLAFQSEFFAKKK